MYLTQVSIPAFYLHTFPGDTICFMSKALLGIVIAGSLGALLFQINQLSPVCYAWEMDAAKGGGQCVDLNKLLFAQCGVNVDQHFFILLLPLPSLLRLNIERRRRILLLLLLGLGGL